MDALPCTLTAVGASPETESAAVSAAWEGRYEPAARGLGRFARPGRSAQPGPAALVALGGPAAVLAVRRFGSGPAAILAVRRPAAVRRIGPRAAAGLGLSRAAAAAIVAVQRAKPGPASGLAA